MPGNSTGLSQEQESGQLAGPLSAAMGPRRLKTKRENNYGRERMKMILADNSTLHPDEILQTIVRKIAAFRGTNPQNDDITLALVKID